MTLLCDQTNTRLKVEGSDYVIDAIRDNALSGKNSVSIMNTLVPMSPIIQYILPEQIPNWETANWGAVFGDYDTEIVERSLGSITFDFWSWYNPLLIGLETISAKFPTVTLRGSYVQLRGFETGTYVIKDGQLISFDRKTADDDEKLRDMMYSWSAGGKEQWVEFTNDLLAHPGVALV